MAIFNQLFRSSHSIILSYPWILFLIDPVYDFGYSIIMAFVTPMNSWFQIIIGTIAGFLIANLILSISSTIGSQSAKTTLQSQSLTSEYTSIDDFIESIERYPQPSKSKPKPPISNTDLWAKEIRRQAENANNDINNEIDDDPGETSLFAEDYISQSDHNKALASLNHQIGCLIQQISKRDQLLQKARAETIYAERTIDELQDEVNDLKTDQETKKHIIKDLQTSNDQKENLIHELHAHAFKSTHEFPLEEKDSLHYDDQEQTSPIQQEATPSEGKQKAEDVMTYIPPNRRSLSQA